MLFISARPVSFGWVFLSFFTVCCLDVDPNWSCEKNVTTKSDINLISKIVQKTYREHVMICLQIKAKIFDDECIPSER